MYLKQQKETALKLFKETFFIQLGDSLFSV